MRHLALPRPTRNDAVLAAAVAALVVLPTIGLELFHNSPYDRPLSDRYLLGYALLATGTVPLAWLSAAPRAVVPVVVGSAALYYPLAYPDGPLMLGAVAALFLSVARGHRLLGWSMGLAQWLVVQSWELGATGGGYFTEAIGVLAWVLVVLVAAEGTRWRRDYRDAAEHSRVEAARVREEEILRRAADERLRLAREVHDTVAHSISLINVQAGTALYLIESEPERAAQALATIKETSKSTLQELRSTLNVLRSVDEAAPRAPTPTLDGVEALVEGTRRTGVDVDFTLHGARRPLGTPVETAAYRIIQESLTNAVRHSGAARVAVDVDYRGGLLRITVADDGTGAPDAVPGNGLTGMRERAEALGGSLTASSPAGGGFTVEAELPAPGTAAAHQP
ncbi:sensor histidine kinase [Nocardiopsis coralliicola]